MAWGVSAGGDERIGKARDGGKGAAASRDAIRACADMTGSEACRDDAVGASRGSGASGCEGSTAGEASSALQGDFGTGMRAAAGPKDAAAAAAAAAAVMFQQGCGRSGAAPIEAASRWHARWFKCETSRSRSASVLSGPSIVLRKRTTSARHSRKPRLR